ncbi:hypothetical protein GCM10023224_28840 [Streptomonospora halophila]|uniref:Uncharacterized protein n=1 Tax=Streptomonospora halophila TaxID=427369 RepID=A0ABP9GRB6_9ACTN
MRKASVGAVARWPQRPDATRSTFPVRALARPRVLLASAPASMATLSARPHHRPGTIDRCQDLPRLSHRPRNRHILVALAPGDRIAAQIPVVENLLGPLDIDGP